MKNKTYYSLFLILLSSTLFSQVGIRTHNPTTSLDVNGDLRIRKMDKVSASDTFFSVVANQDGVIKKTLSSTGNSYAFNYINFKINNVDKDWVSDLDTKISSSDYILIIVGAVFDQDKLVSTSNTGYNPLNLSATVKNGTWHLHADYNGGSSVNNGNWTINTIAINRSVIKQIDTQTINLGGSSTGSLNSSPMGL